MPAVATPRPRTAVDPTDGRPVRAARAGSRLAGDHLAWRRLAVGHRLETWTAWSLTAWAPVVLKLPRPDQVDHPRARATLAREAHALERAGHPGLPRLLEDHHDDRTPWIALEWLDGPALDDALDEHGPLPPTEALALAAQLTAVLRRLHARGLAHLDLTPANVVVRGGWPMLIDLGAARPLGERPDGPGATGTAGYCAPELERGEPVTAAMDVYGLGALVRDAVRGEHGELPDHPVTPLVAALLDPDPRRRPGDADAVLERLHAAAVDGPPLWPPFAERRRRLDPAPPSHHPRELS